MLRQRLPTADSSMCRSAAHDTMPTLYVLAGGVRSPQIGAANSLTRRMTAYELRGLVGLGKRASARHRTHLAFHHLDFGWLSHLDLRRRILGLCWATRHQPSGYSTPSARCARRTAASSAAPNP